MTILNLDKSNMVANSRLSFEFSSWYNKQSARKWLVPLAFMAEMSCMCLQMLETDGCLSITLEHLSLLP